MDTRPGVGILVCRVLDRGEDDGREHCRTVARGDGAPDRGSGERQRRDALMSAHHHLPFRGLVGRGLRHVSVLDGRRRALIGGRAGAFELKARDEWIGWLPGQQFRRLHLIANNTRFVILHGGESGLSVVGDERSSGVGRHARGAWSSGAARRDVRGSKPVRRHVLPGVELAGARAHAGVCPRAEQKFSLVFEVVVET